MKALFLLALFVLIFSKSISNQSVTKIIVPEVKESTQVDAALKKELPMAIPGKSFFLCETYIQGTTYHLHVSSVKRNDFYINFYDVSYSNNVRHFNYLGYLVFVVGTTEDPYHFFTTASKKKVFSFLINGNKYKIHDKWQSDDYKRNFRNLDFFKYEKGQFVSEQETVY